MTYRPPPILSFLPLFSSMVGLSPVPGVNLHPEKKVVYIACFSLDILKFPVYFLNGGGERNEIFYIVVLRVSGDMVFRLL